MEGTDTSVAFSLEITLTVRFGQEMCSLDILNQSFNKPLSLGNA